MMIFMGLVLLVWFITAFLNKGNFKRFLENAKEFESITNDDLEKDKKLREKTIMYVIKCIGVLILTYLLLVIQIMFLIGAFSVDFLILPTLLMLGSIVYKIIRFSTSEAYREKSKIESKKLFTKQFIRGIKIVYIIYILILLVF